MYSAAVDEGADSVTVTAAANDGDTTVAFSLAEDGDAEDRLTQPRVFRHTNAPSRPVLFSTATMCWTNARSPLVFGGTPNRNRP